MCNITFLLVFTVSCLCWTRPCHALTLSQRLTALQLSVDNALAELVRINETLGEIITAVSCPANFTRYQQSCYYFSALILELGWGGAKVLCQMKGSNLVAIETKQEADFISTHTSGIGGYLWTSAHRHQHGSYWTWESTGANITDGYQPWASDQPNQPTVYCGLFRPSDGKLYDHMCHTAAKRGYICEKIVETV